MNKIKTQKDWNEEMKNWKITYDKLNIPKGYLVYFEKNQKRGSRGAFDKTTEIMQVFEKTGKKALFPTKAAAEKAVKNMFRKNSKYKFKIIQ